MRNELLKKLTDDLHVKESSLMSNKDTVEHLQSYITAKDAENTNLTQDIEKKEKSIRELEQKSKQLSESIYQKDEDMANLQASISDDSEEKVKSFNALLKEKELIMVEKQAKD